MHHWIRRENRHLLLVLEKSESVDHVRRPKEPRCTKLRLQVVELEVNTRSLVAIWVT